MAEDDKSGTVGWEEVDPDTHFAAPREQVLRRMEALHQASLNPVGREKLFFGLDSPQDQTDAAVASLLSEALMEEPEAGWYKLTEAGRAAARAAEAADQWAQTLPPDDGGQERLQEEIEKLRARLRLEAQRRQIEGARAEELDAELAGAIAAAKSEPVAGRETTGQAILIHRDEILEQTPALKEAAGEILAKYEQDRPNDEATQEFVEKLKILSAGLDDYVAVLKAGPSEDEAVDAGQSLFDKVMACIEALEKTDTGDRLIRLASYSALLGLAAIATPLITPYFSIPLMTACVFPGETKKAVSLLKVLGDYAGQAFKRARPIEHDQDNPSD